MPSCVRRMNRLLTYTMVLLILRVQDVKAVPPTGCTTSCKSAQAYPGYDVIIDEGCSLSNVLSNSVSRGRGPVQNFFVACTPVVHNQTQETSHSKIKVTWQPPAEDEVAGNQGYEVKLINVWDNTAICYIYNLTGVEEGDEMYTHDCDTCERTETCTDFDCESNMIDGYYQVVVSSLPKTVYKTQSLDALVTITGPKAVDLDPSRESSPGCWETDFVILHQPCSSNSTLVFQTAPQFGYEFYRIFLRELNTAEDLVAEKINAINSEKYVMFSTTEEGPGTFLYKMRPDGTPQGNICEANNPCSVVCKTSTSFSFVVKDSNSMECVEMTTSITTSGTAAPYTAGTTSECVECSSPKLSPEKLVAILVGVIVGLVLIIVVGVLISKRRHQDSNGLDIKSKRVLILYSNDYSVHKDVVQRFAFYLKKRCSCDVHIDLWAESEIKLEQSNWLPREIQVADSVIIVVSKGAEKKVTCFQSQCLMPSKHETFLGDNFLQGYELIRKLGLLTATDGTCNYAKVIGVRFEYTPGHVSILQLQKTFALASELKPLISHIHGVKKLPHKLSDMMDDNKDDSEAKLLTSISNMSSYTAAHPSWFEEYHGFRTEFDERTATSATDSCGVSRNGTIETTSEAPLITNGVAIASGQLYYPPDHQSFVPPDNISNVTDITVNISKYNADFDIGKSWHSERGDLEEATGVHNGMNNVPVNSYEYVV